MGLSFLFLSFLRRFPLWPAAALEMSSMIFLIASLLSHFFSLSPIFDLWEPVFGTLMYGALSKLSPIPRSLFRNVDNSTPPPGGVDRNFIDSMMEWPWYVITIIAMSSKWRVFSRPPRFVQSLRYRWWPISERTLLDHRGRLRKDNCLVGACFLEKHKCPIGSNLVGPLIDGDTNQIDWAAIHSIDPLECFPSRRRRRSGDFHRVIGHRLSTANRFIDRWQWDAIERRFFCLVFF